MTIIGLSGKKQSGKDTVANIVAAYAQERNLPLCVTKVNFADALYVEVAVGLWPTIAYQIPAIDAKVAFLKANKPNFRLILQGWGTDYRRKMHGENYWINKWQYRINYLAFDEAKQQPYLILCCDCRFPNELEALRANGAYMWRVNRTVAKDEHESETSLDNATFDYTFQNDGTIDELKQQVLEQLKQVK